MQVEAQSLKYKHKLRRLYVNNADIDLHHEESLVVVYCWSRAESEH